MQFEPREEPDGMAKNPEEAMTQEPPAADPEQDGREPAEPAPSDESATATAQDAPAKDTQAEPGSSDPPEVEEDPTTNEEGLDAQADRVAQLESELAGLREENEETKQRWLRSRADYDNLKRRTDREREDIRKTAAARLIGELLPQIEILERASRELDELDPAHAKGVQMAVDGLRRALEQEGLQEVPGEGEAFDPNVHEAVAHEVADTEAGTVIEVVRRGYRLHERLLQPALVKVSAGPEKPDPQPASAQE